MLADIMTPEELLAIIRAVQLCQISWPCYVEVVDDMKPKPFIPTEEPHILEIDEHIASQVCSTIRQARGHGRSLDLSKVVASISKFRFKQRLSGEEILGVVEWWSSHSQDHGVPHVQSPSEFLKRYYRIRSEMRYRLCHRTFAITGEIQERARQIVDRTKIQWPLPAKEQEREIVEQSLACVLLVRRVITERRDQAIAWQFLERVFPDPDEYVQGWLLETAGRLFSIPAWDGCLRGCAISLSNPWFVRDFRYWLQGWQSADQLWAEIEEAVLNAKNESRL